MFICQGLVRFCALYRIKPHAPPLVQPPSIPLSFGPICHHFSSIHQVFSSCRGIFRNCIGTLVQLSPWSSPTQNRTLTLDLDLEHARVKLIAREVDLLIREEEDFIGGLLNLCYFFRFYPFWTYFLLRTSLPSKSCRALVLRYKMRPPHFRFSNTKMCFHSIIQLSLSLSLI